MATADTVLARVAQARYELSAREIAIGLSFLTALTFALVLMQDPMAHDSLHNFRHSAGITCH